MGNRADGRHLLVAPTAVYLPMTLALVTGAAIGEGLVMAAAMIGVGVLLWTVGEYVVHRFVQHGTLVDAKYIQNHLTHHLDPEPAEHFVYSLAQTLPIVPLVFGEAWLVTWDLERAMGVAAGIIGSYLANEWVHFVAHRPALSEGRPLLSWMAKNHLRHHQVNASRHFGFFTSFWDRLLGTN
jgi:sterol desaturase/sphingolipid hydroxylase (fatty acid hydroxylase superfamily)